MLVKKHCVNWIFKMHAFSSIFSFNFICFLQNSPTFNKLYCLQVELLYIQNHFTVLRFFKSFLEVWTEWLKTFSKRKWYYESLIQIDNVLIIIYKPIQVKRKDKTRYKDINENIWMWQSVIHVKYFIYFLSLCL